MTVQSFDAASTASVSFASIVAAWFASLKFTKSTSSWADGARGM